MQLYEWSTWLEFWFFCFSFFVECEAELSQNDFGYGCRLSCFFSSSRTKTISTPIKYKEYDVIWSMSLINNKWTGAAQQMRSLELMIEEKRDLLMGDDGWRLATTNFQKIPAIHRNQRRTARWYFKFLNSNQHFGPLSSYLNIRFGQWKLSNISLIVFNSSLPRTVLKTLSNHE